MMQETVDVWVAEVFLVVDKRNMHGEDGATKSCIPDSPWEIQPEPGAVRMPSPLLGTLFFSRWSRSSVLLLLLSLGHGILGGNKPSKRETGGLDVPPEVRGGQRGRSAGVLI